MNERKKTIFSARPCNSVLLSLATPLLCYLSFATDKSPAPTLAYKHATEALQRGDLHSAQIAFEQVIRATPGNAAAHAYLGWILAQQKEFDKAATQLQSAIRMKPSFVTARITLARRSSPSKETSTKQNSNCGSGHPLRAKMLRHIECWAARSAGPTSPMRRPNCDAPLPGPTASGYR